MKYLAIIPARKGSKRFPGKNLADLGGKPLIAHSMDYALENNPLLEAICVTSDDAEVLELARNRGLMAIERPLELASDHATTADALKHAQEQIEADFDAVILLQPTNPLRPKDLMKKAIEAFEGQHSDSLVCVSPLQHKYGTIEAGAFKPENYAFGQRSQDMAPRYFENGLIYITKRASIASGNVVTDQPHPLIVDHPFAQVDIDYPADLSLASFLHLCDL